MNRVFYVLKNNKFQKLEGIDIIKKCFELDSYEKNAFNRIRDVFVEIQCDKNISTSKYTFLTELLIMLESVFYGAFNEESKVYIDKIIEIYENDNYDNDVLEELYKYLSKLIIFHKIDLTN